MSKKHINKFPIGTLVEFKTVSVHSSKEIIGIVLNHTSMNVIVWLSESYCGRRKWELSPERLTSIQRLHVKPKAITKV